MTDDVQFEQHGRLGVITLDRPRAINALTRDMIVAIHDRLDAWASDDSVGTVAIRGAGDRGLCGGGDVTKIAIAYREGTGDETAADFFRSEYRLDYAVATFPKPYVALMDGVVLGGGVGISAHGSHRVVTERSKIGMPETGIGFVPDVGGTWLLAHAPDGMGVVMGLAGTPVGPGDAVRAGFADAVVPTDRLGELLERLEREPAGDVVAALRVPTPEPEFSAEAGWTRQLPGAADVSAAIEIIRQAAGDGSLVARDAVEAIATRSPMSLAVAFEAIRKAATSSLADALTTEYRLARRIAASHDFAEGVRAQLIDKDRNPRWNPATLADVDPAAVEAAFAPLEDGELGLPA